MAISAEFTVNGDPNPAAHEVAYGATVTLALTSTSGANSILWEVMGSSHEDVTFPAITPAGTPSGATATFAMVADPLDGEGRSVLVRCTVTDSAGRVARQGAIIGVLNDSSSPSVPVASGEVDERSATHGWGPELNRALAVGGGGGTGDVVGPAGATSGNLARYSSGTGKAVSDSGIAAADVIKRTGTVPFTADQPMGGHKHTGLQAGSATGHSVEYDQMNAAIAVSLAGLVKADGTVPLTAAWALGNQALTGIKTQSFNGEIDNATSTIDFTTGALQKKTLAANTTLATPTPPPPFTDVRMRFMQPSSGGTYNYTLTFWGGISWVGNVPTMPTGAGVELIVSGYHDGTTWRLAGVVTDFGTYDVRTTGHFVGASSGTPTATSDAGSFESCTTSSGSLRGLCHRQASADANGARVVLQKCRGTHASPAAVAAEDSLGTHMARGHDGSAFYDAGTFRHIADAAGGTSKRTRAQSQLHNGTALATTEDAVQHVATTTDATLTVVRSIALAADSVLRCTYAIVGAQNSSSNRAIRSTTVTVRRSGSGDPVVVAYADACPLFKDDGTWGSDVEIGHQINTTTDALEIIVKGKAATTIAWTVDIQYGAR